MSEGLQIFTILILLSLLLTTVSYVLYAHPVFFFERIIARRWRVWGVEARLVDEAKFRRMARMVALLLLSSTVLVLFVTFSCPAIRMTKH